MSRTYKKYTPGYHRGNRGHSQGLRRKLTREEQDECLIPAERKGAIPPDPWDDTPLDHTCHIPTRAAKNMRDQGFSYEEAIKRLRRKFKFSQVDAEETAGWIYEIGW